MSILIINNGTKKKINEFKINCSSIKVKQSLFGLFAVYTF